MKLNRKILGGGGTRKFLTCLLTLVLVVSTIPILPSTAQGEGQEDQTTVQTQDNASSQEQVSGETNTQVEPATDAADSQEQQTQDSSSADTQQEEAQTQSEDADSAQADAQDTQAIQANTSNEAVLSSNDYVISTSTCKIVRDDTPIYYDTLTEAIADLQDGDTIEIFKSHTIKEVSTITASNVTIKNITNPTDDRDNPTQNLSADVQPVITFTVDAAFTISSDVTLSGVIFDGGGTERSTAPIVVNGGTTTISDGAVGADDTGIEATTCTFRNFTTASATGLVFNIASGAGLTISGGSIESNTSTNDKGSSIYSSGTLTMSSGTITGNTAYIAGAIYAAAGTVSISGDAKITRNTSRLTGLQSSAGIYMEGDSSVTISGGEISGNYARGGAGAVIVSSTSNKLTITGGKITGNKSMSANIPAVYCYASGADSAGDVMISGNAYIYGNGIVTADSIDADITGARNISASYAQTLSIGDLTVDARLGFSRDSLCAASTQFAVASSGTASTTKYLSCISNDVNPQYAAVAGAGSAIQWNDGTAVCKIVRNGITKYYANFVTACNNAADTGDTIEIFKTHATSSSWNTFDIESITVQNIVTPLSAAEDPSKNGSVNDDSGQPVVYFSKNDDTAYKSSTMGVGNSTRGKSCHLILSGVVFSGDSYVNGTVSSYDRTSGACMGVGNGSQVDVSDGVAGTNLDGSERAACETVLKNFVNTSQTDASAGGVFRVAANSTVNFNSGTITGCKANSNNWVGGGNVAYVNAGTFNMYGGTITGNGYDEETADDANWGSSTFYIYNGGTFYMNGGSIVGNKSRPGGAVILKESCNATVEGDAVISNNRSTREGGAFYVSGYSTGMSTLTLAGNAKITNNSAKFCAGAINLRDANSQVKISGNVEITGNTSENTKNAAGAAFEASANSIQGKVYISGTPNISGNGRAAAAGGAITVPADIYVNAANMVNVAGNFEKGAKVGIYTTNAAMDGAGENFAVSSTGGDASTIENLPGTFFSNRDASLLSVAGDGVNVKWAAAIVKETVGSDGTGAFVAYYDSLNEAAAHVTAGNSLEIMKTHALKTTLSDGSSGNVSFAASCTVRNILNPTSAAENPFVDADGNPSYSDAAEPVVYFGNANTAAGSMQLIVPAGVTVDLKGVKFSGYYYDGTNAAAASTTRAQAGISVAASGTLTIADMPTLAGEESKAGVLPDGSERGACATVIENFYNTSTDAATCGGALRIEGNATMSSGTLSGNKANGSGWISGGAAMCVYGENGNFTMDGGTIEKQTVANGAVGDNTISVFAATFTMNKGTIQNNTGHCAGAIWVSSLVGSSTAAGTVNINGGQILNNTATNDCGAVWSNGTTTIKDCLIKGNTGNIGAVCARATYGTVKISGHTQIVGNYARSAGRGALGWFSTNTNLGSITLEGSPVIKGNTNTASNKEINLDDTSANESGTPLLKVGTLNSDAYIGMTPIAARNGSTDATKLFAYSVNADADNAGYLKAFYNQSTNDDEGYPLRGMAGDDNQVVWGTTTPTVKVTETVTASDGTQTDVVHTFGGTTAIKDAFACVKELPASNVVAGKKADGVTDKDYVGYFPVECLVDTYTLTEAANIDSSPDVKVLLTTAKTDVEDGYPYRGDAASENGRALVKRAFTGASLIPLWKNNSGANLTTRNIVFDGVSGTYSGGTASLRAFYLNNGTSLTLGSGTLIRNSNAGNDGIGGAVYIVPATSAASGSKLYIEDGAVIDSCTAAGNGGAVYGGAYSTITMEGGTISNCKSTAVSNGGAVCLITSEKTAELDVATTSATTMTMSGGSITGCSANNGGGAIGIINAQVTITGTASLSGNSAPRGGAVYLCGTGTNLYGAKVTIGGNASITGNTTTNTSTGAPGAVAVYETVPAAGQIVLSGSPKIYDNWDASGETGGNQRNVFCSTALNVGNQIQVGVKDDEGNVTGLNDDAKIGVYAKTNYNAGNTFARTVTTKSTDYENLSVFKNDKNTRLTGLASAADPYNRVVWSSTEPLTITKTIPAAVTDDTWFTVQLVNNTTGDIYRQSIKVEAGQTSGSATLVLQSGFGYTVTDVSAQSNWRYANSAAAYAGYADSEWSADATGASIGTVTLDGYSANRTLTLTTAKTSDVYVSENTSVVNTITVPEN